MQDENKASNKFCVWITTEPSDRVPDFLICNLHKLSWNHLTLDTVETKTGGDNEESGSGGGGVTSYAVSYRSPQTYLHTGVYILQNVKKICN